MNDAHRITECRPQARRASLRRRASAYSILDALVLVAVIAAAAALIAPALAQQQGESQVAVCLSNQREIAKLFANHAADHDDQLPYRRIWPPQGSDGFEPNPLGMTEAWWSGRLQKLYDAPIGERWSKPETARALWSGIWSCPTFREIAPDDVTANSFKDDAYGAVGFKQHGLREWRPRRDVRLDPATTASAADPARVILGADPQGDETRTQRMGLWPARGYTWGDAGPVRLRDQARRGIHDGKLNVFFLDGHAISHPHEEDIPGTMGW
ncbi:MAG: hypothetical protein GVY24_05605 [Planctomycetes bacterium]|nr:hypothetical protein [Planctomycetota bacterium]